MPLACRDRGAPAQLTLDRPEAIMPVPSRSSLTALTLLVSALAGCTAKFQPAIDHFETGNCDQAKSTAHELAPTKLVPDRGAVADSQYDRDDLWVTLEKSRLLSCCGDMDESMSLLYFVKGESEFYRDIESRYKTNPLDIGSWDASQFANDAGQAVLGADQLPYEVQPFEMILCNAYGALNCLLIDEPGAAEFSTAAGQLQDDEGKDLAALGYLDNMPSPAGKIDGVVRAALPPNSSSNYSTNMVFSAGDFSRAKSELASAIDAGRAAGAADPRIAFASAVAWASYFRDGKRPSQEEAIRGIEIMARAPQLTASMRRIYDGDESDFVLVLVDAGRGPKRNFFTVTFPIIIPNVGSAYFRAVYPVLQFRPQDRPTTIQVKGEGDALTAELLSSVDAIAARDFRRREAALWWTPTIRAAIRVIGAIVAQAADRDKEGWGAIVAITTAVMAAAEQPDLRNWSTLPGSQYGVIVKRPPHGMVHVRLIGDSGTNTVSVGVPEGSSIIHVCAQTPQNVKTQTGSLAPPRSGSSAPAPTPPG